MQANLVVNGGLLVYSGLIEGFGGAAGTIGGTGTITIAALGSSGSLILNATETAPIQFQLYSLNGTPYAFENLELRGPLRTGVISGFIAGDTIIIDQHVTGVTFTQTTNSQGTLTLTNGAATIGTLTLNGNFAGDLFQADVAAQTGVTTTRRKARHRHRQRRSQHRQSQLRLDRRQRRKLDQRVELAGCYHRHHPHYRARQRQRGFDRRHDRRWPIYHHRRQRRGGGADDYRQRPADRSGQRRRIGHSVQRFGPCRGFDPRCGGQPDRRRVGRDFRPVGGGRRQCSHAARLRSAVQRFAACAGWQHRAGRRPDRRRRR